VRLGWRGPFGDIDWPAPFGPLNLGSAWSGYVWTNWNRVIAAEDLFWEQHLGPTFSFQIGNLGPQGTLNTFRFKDARNSFSASKLNFSETIPWPAFGAGASFRWRPGFAPGYFVNGVINDMNGNPGENEGDFLALNWSHLNIDQLFVGTEIGRRWQRSNGEFDLLSVNVFHAGTRDTFNPEVTPNKAGWGFKINFEKQWSQFVGFGSYAYTTAQGGGISTTFSGNTAYLGAAYLRPFDINGAVGLAALWTRPFKDIFPGSGQRDQYGLDAYWNIAVSPNSTLTPGAQLIIHPSFNPAADVVFMPTVLFRLFL
jgi:carbohydrate-selective porin OprB